MICFPNAKINLGLAITEKRPDGFHNLETCFYPIPLYDVLEFTESKSFELDLFGNKIEGFPTDNLLSRVWKQMNLEFGIPPVKVVLLKQIPSGAGLGGGSSDAAFFLRELNGYFQLGLTIPQMEKLALTFGSDCPFFIRNKPVLATGRGELMTDFSLSLADFYLTVIFPELFISTAAAFRRVRPQLPDVSLRKILQKKISSWQDELRNDFQPIVNEMFPEIGALIEKLYQNGAFYAGLSGSGSSVFALSEAPLISVKYASGYKVFSWKL